MLKIGFCGAGKMAEALAKGFIAAGLTKGELILASCLPNDSLSAKAFQEIGSRTVSENKSVADHGDVLIVAVKPQAMPAVLSDLKKCGSKKLTLSIAMGVPLATLEKALPEGTPVIRVMPNTPALVGYGATVYSRGLNASDKECAIADRLFSSVGICEEVSESSIDPVTALAGSGPAYVSSFLNQLRARSVPLLTIVAHLESLIRLFSETRKAIQGLIQHVYVMIEALADGGVKMGLSRSLAYKLAAQTIIGGGKMVLETGRHPGQLKDDVTSPGGSTITALHHLERHSFRSSIIGAIEAATIRCREVTASGEKAVKK